MNKYTVLITRPKDQNRELIQSIQNLGWEAIVLPTLDIVNIADSGLDSDLFLNFQQAFIRSDIIILVTRNAVYSLPQIWIDFWIAFSKTQPVSVITMGKATTQSAVERGLTVEYTPPAGFTSENLLETPLLQAQALKNKQVLILTGEGGRDLLGESLSARGANVVCMPVYRRQCPTYSENDLKQIFEPWLKLAFCSGRHGDRPLQAILITSNNALDNLLSIIASVPELAHKLELKKIPLIVPSLRVKKYCLQQGFNNIRVAASARDNDMLAQIQTVV